MPGLQPRGSRRTAAAFLLIGLVALVPAGWLALLPVTASVVGAPTAQCGRPFRVIFGSSGASGDLEQPCTNAAMPHVVAAATLVISALLLLLLAVYAWLQPLPADALSGSRGSFKLLSVLGFIGALAAVFGVTQLVGFDWPWHHAEIVGIVLSAVYGTGIVSCAQCRWPSPDDRRSE